MADDDTILLGINRNNVERAFACDTYPAPLPDGVVMNSVMLAEEFTTRVDDFPFAWKALSFIFRFEIAINEARIITIRHKADLLRLSFLCDGQITRARHVAYFRL